MNIFADKVPYQGGSPDINTWAWQFLYAWNSMSPEEWCELSGYYDRGYGGYNRLPLSHFTHGTCHPPTTLNWAREWAKEQVNP